MNRRHSVPVLALVALAGLGILFALLRPRGLGRTSDDERRGPGTPRVSGEPGGPAASSASLDNRAVSVSEVLALPELRAAVGSFRLVDTMMNAFPAESNGRKRLAALQQRLFRDDVAFASGLDPRIACEQVPEMLDRLKAGSSEGGSPGQASTARSIPWPERLIKARSASLAERHKVLIADTRQSGIAVIVELLALHLDQPVPGSGAFQDAGLYAALRTYLLEAQAENSRESAAVIRKLKKEFSDPNPAIAANHANAVEAESAEYRQVLEAYQSIFAYRLGNWLGIEGNELIERLAKATVSGVGSEWNVPCARRY